jgi:single-strand DNA-binding protein
MSYTINRVVLVARLTRDPELRALPSGASVCHIRVACNSRHRDADGELQERPNYFDVSAFGTSGESVAQFMRKGSRVAIDGRLEWREWESAEQQRRQAVSIVADSVQFLDSPSARESEADEIDGEGGEAREDALVF